MQQGGGRMAVGLNALRGYVGRKQGLAREAGAGEGGAAGAARMAERAFGFYGTAPTCHLSMLARLAAYRTEDLDGAVAVERSVVRLRAMRKTLFLVATADFAVVHTATRASYGDMTRLYERRSGLSPARLEAAKRAIVDTLRDGPLLKADIRERVKLPASELPLFDILMHALSADGAVVRAASRRGWRSDVVEYALLETWLPDFDPDALTGAEAQARLARRYFESFGPASAADFRWWSGLSKPEIDAALASLAADVVPVGVDGLGDGLHVLAPEAEALRAAAPLRATRLLPIWDGYLMGYPDRDRFLDAAHRSAVIDRSGNATSTLWIDGAIGGVWDFTTSKDTIEVKVAPFRGLAKARWREVRSEAERIATLASAGGLTLLDCGPPPALDAGIDPARRGYVGPGQNRFRAPLKDVAGAPAP